MNSLTLNIPSVLRLTDEQFEQLAAANRDLRLELTAKGELDDCGGRELVG